MTVKELQEKQAPLGVEIHRMAGLDNDADHKWSAEDEVNWKQLNADYDALGEQIGRAQRSEEIERHNEDTRAADSEATRRALLNQEVDHRENTASGGDTGPTEAQRALALQAWFRAGNNSCDLSTDHEEACRAVGFNPHKRTLEVNLSPTSTMQRLRQLRSGIHGSMFVERAAAMLAEKRDLSAVLAATGGVTVPEGFVNALEINLLAFGGMLQVADIMRTATGNDLPWPTADDTSNTGVQLGESTSIGSSVDPDFAAVIFKAYKFSSKLVKVPTELLEDSAFDMASVIGAMLGERLGRITNTKFTTGTGASTPKGIITAASLGVTTNTETAILDTELIDLEHSVDPAYRNGAGFMMHDSIIATIRKLKADGVFVWQPGLTTGRPDQLLGYPVTVNQDMDSALTSLLKTVLFGQLSKYKARQVNTIRFKRLDERYADTDQVGFIAFLRQDGNLLDAGTKPVKYLQQKTA